MHFVVVITTITKLIKQIPIFRIIQQIEIDHFLFCVFCLDFVFSLDDLCSEWMAASTDISCLCLGPKQSGKTHLMTSLQVAGTVTNVSHSVPTIGTNIFRIKLPDKLSTVKMNAIQGAAASTTSTTATANSPAASSLTAKQPRKSVTSKIKEITVLEIGGSMAPMWKNYLSNITKILYVVDTSNLCQISAAGEFHLYIFSMSIPWNVNCLQLFLLYIPSGVLLYTFLADPRLQHTKVLLVLTKMDLAYRQMRNEALLMLQFAKLKKQIRQSISIVETSAITCIGHDKILDWLSIP